MQSLTRYAALAAMAVGISAGSYGIAGAATGAPRGWGGQRSDETPLTGDALAKVTAAAQAKLGSGATIERVETDADGNAKYEAHYTAADGTLGTVYVDASYAVISVETR